MAEKGIVLPWKVKGKGRFIQLAIYVIVLSLLFIFLKNQYPPDTPFLNIVLMVLAIVIIGYPLYSIRWKLIKKERKRIDAEKMKKREEK